MPATETVERESSDEDDDVAALVVDPLPGAGKSPRRPAAPLDAVRRLIGRSFNKWYLLSLSLPLFLFLLYLSLDVGSLFRASPFSAIAVPPPQSGGQMREAELRALYLLQNQRLGLLRLWNRSFGHGEGFPSNAADFSLDEIRSALVDQIKLNKEIQQSLLLSHRVENVSELVDGGVASQFGVDACKKVVPASGRRSIEWKPKAERYLFAICVSGPMSNHLICLEKHMFFAALLDRVLVLPSPKFYYDYDRVVDIENMNKCFGREVVITFDEFARLKKKKKKHLHIDRFICYVTQPPCYLDDGHLRKLKSLGLSMGKIEAAWPKDGKPDQPKKRKVGDVMPVFSSDDEVLAIGDMFFASVEDEWVMQPGGPLAHKCRTVIPPSRPIILTAQRFIQTFLGGNFIALHFRRHGFLKLWYMLLLFFSEVAFFSV